MSIYLMAIHIKSVGSSPVTRPIHLMGVFVALKFDKRFGTARFPSVKHKASSTPFLYIGSLPLSHSKARLRQENSRKVSK